MNTEYTQKNRLIYEELTYKLIGAAKEVHLTLGGGLLESVYENALCYELQQSGIKFERQVEIDVYYKNVVFKNRFKADLIAEKKVLIENKAIQALTIRDEAQLLNCLKLTRLKVGLLFNFGLDKFQFKRKVN